MRKWLMVLIMTSTCVICAAGAFAGERVEVSGDEVRLGSQGKTWQPTSVTVSLKAQKFPDAWQQAFEKPEEIIPVETSVRMGKMTDLFHQQKETIIERGVRMDGDTIDVVPGNGAVSERGTRFNPFIIFVVVVIALMACSNGIIWRGGRADAILALALALVLALAAFVSLATTLLALAAFAAFVSLATTATAKKINETAYWLASACFYDAMIAVVVLQYA